MLGCKKITAGPLCLRILGQVPDTSAQKKSRGARVNPTPPAQAFYNEKRSWMELRLWIAANFYRKSYFVTFTYLDEFLPDSKEAAEKKLMAKFIRKLRSSRAKRRKELKYIYVTEAFHGIGSSDFLEEDGQLEDKRIHHHMIINGTGPEDFDELRSLWPGRGYVRIEPFDVRYCTAAAKYMTKEAREFGRTKPGSRTWKRSMNLTKYQVEYIDIPMDGLRLDVPPGAVNYESFHEKNPYGFADCVGDQYFLFEEPEEQPLSYLKGPRKKKPPYN